MSPKWRNPSPSPLFSRGSSATSASVRRHHRGFTPQEKHRSDDYSVETSNSHSQYESNLEEYEEPINDDSNDDDDDYEENASYVGSRSSTEDPFAAKLPPVKSLPQSSDFGADENYFQATSYINVAPLPTFHGKPKECPVAHLSRFTKVCRANNASSIAAMKKIFPVTLEDEAALWYDLNVEPYPSLSWEEIKSAFLQAYHKIELTDDLRNELSTTIQGSEEPVRSYFLRLQWVLNRWPDHGIPDDLLKGIFVDGLRRDVQDWVIPQKPESLPEALRLAFAFEQVRSIKGSREKELKCGFCEGRHEERGCEIRERLRELWRKSKEKKLIKNETSEAAEDHQKEEIISVNNIGNVEDEAEEDGLSGKKKSQCQCGKHQCWKKQIERNSSRVSINSNAE